MDSKHNVLQRTFNNFQRCALHFPGPLRHLPMDFPTYRHPGTPSYTVHLGLKPRPLKLFLMIFLLIALKTRRDGSLELMVKMFITGVRRWSRHRIRRAVIRYCQRIYWDPSRIHPVWLGPSRWFCGSIVMQREVQQYVDIALRNENGMLICTSYHYGPLSDHILVH